MAKVLNFVEMKKEIERNKVIRMYAEFYHADIKTNKEEVVPREDTDGKDVS